MSSPPPEPGPDARRVGSAAEGTRRRLVEAAEALLLESESELAVSVRALERRAGVTAPTIYRHFPDMSTLLAEVARRQFRRLDEAIDLAAGEPDPVAQILGYGRAFARFGLTHPQAYRVLFMNHTRDDRAASTGLREAASYRRLVESVAAGIEQGVVSDERSAEDLAALLLMSLHGVVSMVIARPAGWAEPDDLVEQMMLIVGWGIATGPP